MKKHFIYTPLWTRKNFCIIALLTLVIACSKKDIDNQKEPTPSDTKYSLGLLGTDKPETIPSDIFLGMGSTTLPARHSLVSKLPPIGDQGKYGTCVAWAAGYNLKTTLNAIDKNWSAADLRNRNNQSSAKDLFLAIPSSQKGTNCDGTNFEPAFQQLIRRGVASLDKVPYTNLGGCSQAPDASAKQQAAKNRLENYRKINVDIHEIKTYVSQNRPVVFGAKLSDNFMSWRGGQVLSSHSSFDRVGQHAYHAMMVVGYDDSKGPNGAFRVVNSWGTSWGDNGFIWIDYRFFVNQQFCYIAFVATNKQSDNFDPVDPPVRPTGNYDLIPWNVSDDANSYTYLRNRKLKYNVYNIGTKTVAASSQWNVCYLYYNAYNAKDYGIIIYDEFTNRYGSLGKSGELTSGGYGLAGNWWNHINLPPNKGIAEVQYGTSSVSWTYNMPLISGYYYLVCIADGFDAINETNEANNYFYLTGEYGLPLNIRNGIIQTSGSAGIQSSTMPRNRTSMPTIETANRAANEPNKEANANAYTPSEISDMIRTMKSNGELKQAVQKFKAQQAMDDNLAVKMK